MSRRRSGTAGRSWLQYNIAPGWTEERRAPKQAAMTEPDPDALARRTLRNHRMFASGLLILMATLTVADLSSAAELVERAAASLREGRVYWRHRGLVRRHRAVSPSLGHTNSAYCHHSQSARAAGSGARTFRRQPRFHRRGSVPRAGAVWTCRASCIAFWPTRPPRIRPPSHCQACCQSCWRRWRTAGRDGSSRAWCPASWAGPLRDRWWRGRCTAWSTEAATRRCSASSSGS